jgi:uncharacterized protein
LIDLQQYKSKAKKQAKYHKAVLERVRKIKASDADELFSDAHEEVFKRIDCLQCANCCKTISPIFTTKDIERISKFKSMSFAQFVESYLRIDEDQDYVLKGSPCVFLESDNKCSIYEQRPKACREYPHTDSVKIQKLLVLTQKNISVCPAVFEIVENVGKSLNV